MTREWRAIEEAAINAWPASRTLLLDGWVARFAHGYTKRANSVNPLYASTDPAAAKIEQCEQLYHEAGLPCIFRLSDAGPDPELDALLAARGYTRFDHSLVLTRSLSASDAWQDAPLPENAEPEEWMDAYIRLTGANPASRAAHRAIVANIGAPRVQSARQADDTIVACGLAVCQAPFAGLFDIVVDATQRRQGHGRALIASMLAWAYLHGARRAYIQVVAENAPARRLYESFGFTESYSYWYRIPPRA